MAGQENMVSVNGNDVHPLPVVHSSDVIGAGRLRICPIPDSWTQSLDGPMKLLLDRPGFLDVFLIHVSPYGDI